MLTVRPAFLAESYRACVWARRRSAKHLRSHPHSIRSAKTRSRDPDRRVHNAASALAMATEITTADAVEATISNKPPLGTNAATSAAGTTTTEAVVNRTSGRYRSKRVGADPSRPTIPQAGRLHRLDEDSSEDENIAQ
jgi:hypothetical protein